MNEERTNIGRLHRMAASSISAVDMPLGMWAGNGDWAGMPEDAKSRAAHRALRELDEALAEMAKVREQLAAELDGGAT